MTDEEKKAIENFKYWIDTNTEKGVCYIPDYICKKVLNLIEKQSKEIEELKEENKKLTDEYLVQRDLINPDFLKDYIHKEKIKAKTEEAKKNYNDLHTKHLRDCGIAEQRELAKIEFGQSLLEKE